MIAVNNMFLASHASSQIQMQGAKQYSGNSSPNSDFSSMFQRASESGYSSPESIHGAQPKQKSEKEFISEDLLPDEIDSEKNHNTPDELAALTTQIVPLIIQNQITDPVEVVSSDSIAVDTQNTEISQIADIPISGNAIQTPIASPEAAPIAFNPDGSEILNQNGLNAQQPQVVTTLESNKEIDAQEENAALINQITDNQTEIPEQTARMPQITGQTRLPEEDAKAKPDTVSTPVENSAPCPLESENNKSESNYDSMSENKNGEQSKQQEKTTDTRVFGNSQTVDISPERLISTEQLSEKVETVPQTATVETLYNKLIESITTASTSDSKQMEIHLKPEFLGKVSIQLSLTDSGMQIKIKAEDASVKGLISDQISQLTSSLNDKGVKVTDVEVVFANVADHSYDGSHSHRDEAHQSESSASRNMNIGFGIGFTEEADAVTVVDTGLSSVEYRV